MATTYEPIATTTLGSAASSIVFSGITGTYTDLRMVITYQFSTSAQINFYPNADFGSNKSLTALRGDGGSVVSTRTSGIAWQDGTQYAAVTGSIWAVSTLDVFSYAGSTYKTALATRSADLNGSGFVERVVNMWQSTSAITSLGAYAATGNFSTGTTATLYGILKA